MCILRSVNICWTLVLIYTIVRCSGAATCHERDIDGQTVPLTCDSDPLNLTIYDEAKKGEKCADISPLCENMTVTLMGKSCPVENIAFNVWDDNNNRLLHINFRFTHGKWTRAIANSLYDNKWGVEMDLVRFPYKENFVLDLTMDTTTIKIVGNGVYMGTFNLPRELTTIKRVCKVGCGSVSNITLSTSVCRSDGPGIGGGPGIGDGQGNGDGHGSGDGQGSAGELPQPGTHQGNGSGPMKTQKLSDLLGDTETQDNTTSSTSSTPSASHEQILTAVGLSCSMFCLALSIVVQIYNGNIKTTPGKIMVSLSMSLFSAQFLFMFVDYPFGNWIICKVIAILEHLFWLLALSWSNTMVIDLLRAISRTSTSRSKRTSYWFYALLTTTIPLCIVVTGIVLDFQTMWFRYGIPGNCWILFRLALIYTFMIPAIVSVTLNIALLMKVFVLIYRIRQSTRSLGDDAFLTHRRSAIIGLKLASVMGLTWIFGFLGALLGNATLLYLFTFFNSFQGVTMFFGLTYKHSNVKAWLKARCGRRSQPEPVTETSKASATT